MNVLYVKMKIHQTAVYINRAVQVRRVNTEMSAVFSFSWLKQSTENKKKRESQSKDLFWAPGSSTILLPQRAANLDLNTNFCVSKTSFSESKPHWLRSTDIIAVHFSLQKMSDLSSQMCVRLSSAVGEDSSLVSNLCYAPLPFYIVSTEVWGFSVVAVLIPAWNKNNCIANNTDNVRIT